MTWKLYAVVSAGAFVATYLVSTPMTDQARPAAAAAHSSSRPAKAAPDIRELAARLHTRVREQTEYREPGRDPFRFKPRVVPPAYVPPPMQPAPLPPPAPPQPLI